MFYNFTLSKNGYDEHSAEQTKCWGAVGLQASGGPGLPPAAHDQKGKWPLDRGGGGSALHLNWRRLTKRSVGFISDFLFSLDHNVLYVIQILIKICKFCMLAWFDRLRETTTTIFDLSFFFFFYIFIPHFSMNITSNEKIEKFHLLQGNIRDWYWLGIHVISDVWLRHTSVITICEQNYTHDKHELLITLFYFTCNIWLPIGAVFLCSNQ